MGSQAASSPSRQQCTCSKDRAFTGLNNINFAVPYVFMHNFLLDTRNLTMSFKIKLIETLHNFLRIIRCKPPTFLPSNCNFQPTRRDLRDGWSPCLHIVCHSHHQICLGMWHHQARRLGYRTAFQTEKQVLKQDYRQRGQRSWSTGLSREHFGFS